jgi:hypothetical protein
LARSRSGSCARVHALANVASTTVFAANACWKRPAWFDGSLLARAALTPITLAADLVLGPQALGFFEWVTGGKLAPQPSRDNEPGSR